MGLGAMFVSRLLLNALALLVVGRKFKPVKAFRVSQTTICPSRSTLYVVRFSDSEKSVSPGNNKPGRGEE
jgi:hypothetical protein